MIKKIASSAFALTIVFQAFVPSVAQAAFFIQPVSTLRSVEAIADIELSEITLSAEVENVLPAKKDYTVQEVLIAVCEHRGYGNECAKTLLGMMWTESSNRSAVIGDGGAARGYFQIHYKLHGISTDCAEDLVCSAQWTIDYLERNHYPKYVDYAVQCHNSCNAGNGYTAKATRYGNYFWDQPLEITQAMPIVLPEA